jgi:putative Mg2+ transporter-C (MgtC) family protein
VEHQARPSSAAPGNTTATALKLYAALPRYIRVSQLRRFSFHKGRLLDRFQIGTHFLALAAAFALAVPIGWDREKRARSAGLRTFPLVAMASCGFVQASEGLLVHSPDGMAKVIEGLITGIGFIGGGAILKQGTTVQGTATAASLWATGAIGVSVGLGSYDVAVTIAVFTFLTLRLLTLVKEEGDLKISEGDKE